MFAIKSIRNTVCYFHTSIRDEDSPTFSYQSIHYIIRVVPITISFLLGSYSLGNITEVNWVSVIINAEHKMKQRGHAVFQKCENAERLWTRHFGVQDFTFGSVKHQHTTTSEREKGKVGPAHRGFGVRDFMSSSTQTTIYIQTCEKCPAYRDFGVRDPHTTTPER
jgi:hypothetical protein